MLIAFILTLAAGLSTSVGSFVTFFTKHTNTKLLSFGLGFSAGVMIYIALADILPESTHLLVDSYGSPHGKFIALFAFFSGILITLIIDRLIPSFEDPHEIHKVEEIEQKTKISKNGMLRTGFFVGIAIVLHNIPEGIITYLSYLHNVTLGISLAIAIAIHNIPEGMAISIPIYHATGSKKKAFLYALLAGLAEPFGALIACFILSSFCGDALFGVLFAAVAGIMIFISFDELLPASKAYGRPKLAMSGVICGMVLMAVSLFIMQ